MRTAMRALTEPSGGTVLTGGAGAARGAGLGGGMTGATPVPETAMASAATVASDGIAMAPDAAPTATGAKRIANEHVAATARMRLLQASWSIAKCVGAVIAPTVMPRSPVFSTVTT